MYTLEDSRNELAKLFTNSLNTLTVNKILIKADVGIGKTDCLKNINKFTSIWPLLCFPSHSLKNEFSSNFSIKHIVTPEPPKNFISYQQELNDAGFDQPSIINKLKKQFQSYYKTLENSIDFPGVVLTTHDAFLISPARFLQKTIIFDEVPNNLFGKIYTTSLLGIYELDYLLSTISCFSKTKLDFSGIEDLLIEFSILKQDIEKSKPKSINDPVFKAISNPLSLQSRRLLYNILKIDSFNREYPEIGNILQGDMIIVNFKTLRISKFKEFQFNPKIKHICFSATPDYDIFNSAGFTIQNTKSPEFKASVIHVDINTSRQSLKNMQIIKKINDFIKKYNIQKIITFKCSQENLIKVNSEDIYFGNCLGTNNLLDVNILGLVGTPLNNAQYFYDLSLFCRKNLTFDDFSMEQKKIDFIQKSVTMKTYKSDWLVKKQVEQIGISYLQALGRIRPYSKESMVYIFSKLPIFSSKTIEI